MSATYGTAVSQAKSGLSITGDTPFTSAVWVNMSSWSDAGTDHILTWSNGTNSDVHSIAHDVSDTFLYVGDLKGGTFTGCDFAHGFSLNTWHHYCQVWDGSLLSAYSDGVFANSVALTSTGRVNWTTLTTGRCSGQLENAVVFARALTANEIYDLYCNRRPRLFTSIQVWWPIYDGSPLPDRSGNGNDATASGSITAGTNNPRTALGIGHPIFEAGASNVAIDGQGLTKTSGAAAMTASAPLVAAGNTLVSGSAAMTALAQMQAGGTTLCNGVAVMTSDAPAPSLPGQPSTYFDPRRKNPRPWKPMGGR